MKVQHFSKIVNGIMEIDIIYSRLEKRFHFSAISLFSGVFSFLLYAFCSHESSLSKTFLNTFFFFVCVHCQLKLQLEFWLVAMSPSNG